MKKSLVGGSDRRTIVGELVVLATIVLILGRITYDVASLRWAIVILIALGFGFLRIFIALITMRRGLNLSYRSGQISLAAAIVALLLSIAYHGIAWRLIADMMFFFVLFLIASLFFMQWTRTLLDIKELINRW